MASSHCSLSIWRTRSRTSSFNPSQFGFFQVLTLQLGVTNLFFRSALARDQLCARVIGSLNRPILLARYSSGLRFISNEQQLFYSFKRLLGTGKKALAGDLTRWHDDPDISNQRSILHADHSFQRSYRTSGMGRTISTSRPSRASRTRTIPASATPGGPLSSGRHGNDQPRPSRAWNTCYAVGCDG